MPKHAAVLIAVLFAASGFNLRAEDDLPSGYLGRRAPYGALVDDLNGMFGQKVEHTNLPSRPTLANLTAAVTQTFEAIQSVHVAFDVEDRDLLDLAVKEPIRTEKYSNELLVKGNRYACKRGLVGSSGGNWNIFDGRESRMIQPGRGSGQRVAGMTYQIINGARRYVNLCGIPDFTTDDPLQSLDYPPAMLEFSKASPMRPTLDRVGETLCCTATCGEQTLWLAADAPHEIRRIVKFCRNSAADPGQLCHLVMFDDFRVVGDEVRLPFRVEEVVFRFGSAFPAHLRGTVSRISLLDVKNCRINDVKDDEFNRPFPPGTKVDDRIANTKYIAPGG